MTPANIDYITKDGMVADVVTEISYHHQSQKINQSGVQQQIMIPVLSACKY
mgnify:CR=1 FL=1